VTRRGFVLVAVLLVLTLAGALLAVAGSTAIAALRTGRAWSESVRAEVSAWDLSGASVRVLGDSLLVMEATGSSGRARWPVLVLVRPTGDTASTGTRAVARYHRLHPRP
jgi:hypothetical protein